MNKKLYLEPSEIQITPIPENEYQRKKNWHDRITNHEHFGLLEMGCNISNTDSMTLIENPFSSIAFLNRITSLNMSEEEVRAFLTSVNPKYSFVITPFSLPCNSPEILTEFGYQNNISSTVVGSDVPKYLEIPNNKFQFEEVLTSGNDFDDMFDVFATFFLKPGESRLEGSRRLHTNLNRGTHILVRQRGNAIGMVGTIDHNEISSIYCGIVLPEFRASNILSSLGAVLSHNLIGKGIKHYYGKSRNRAFLLGLKRMFGFEHLYNEKTYILNN